MGKITTEREDDVMPYSEVEFMIDSTNDMKMRSLIAFLYLTGCRISEALAMKREKIWFDDEFMVVDVKVLKRKNFSHIIKISNKAPFITNIIKWLNTLQLKDKIWHFSDNKNSARVMAWRELKKINSKTWPHLFRHTRMTNLAMMGATDVQLMVWAGWSDSRPAGVYVARSASMIEGLGRKLK